MILFINFFTTLLLSVNIIDVFGNNVFTRPLDPVDNRFNRYVSGKAYEDYQILSVKLSNKQQLDRALALESTLNVSIDFWSVDKNADYYTVKGFIKKKDLKTIEMFLKKNQMEYVVSEHNLDELIRHENEKSSIYQFNQVTGFDYSRYHNYFEIVDEMKSLVKSFSSIASIINLGKTYENRDMLAVKIAVKQSPNRKTFFFMCGLHAREWVTTATCIYMIKEMLNGYKKDATVAAMLNKMDWVILPVANVDGYVYSWKDASTRLWRKTRKPTSYQCTGADPNRNFDFQWGKVGTSNDPCSDIYPGSKPWSEKCVFNIAQYLRNNRNTISGFIDIHAYSQLWMTPWGYTTELPKDYKEQMRVASAAVKALYNKHGTVFKVGPSSVIIYPTSGASDDWAYGALGLKYSYGLELRDKGQYGFILPASQIVPTAEETLESFKVMANEIVL
ncbi:carboxypeptidase B isoform X2 [Hydra vulgaris]|uniref:Carboxypeptidase B isoform X2 n=1 Tax=Hydra vulgaris TaxID=6087 RepID=A0ABM4D4S0_HYDVU